MKTPALDQAAALAFELNMHIEDLLDDKEPREEPGVPLVSEDDDQEVGRMVDITYAASDYSFKVRTADGTVLVVSVRPEAPEEPGNEYAIGPAEEGEE